MYTGDQEVKTLLHVFHSNFSSWEISRQRTFNDLRSGIYDIPDQDRLFIFE